jgi:hypothetical protein
MQPIEWEALRPPLAPHLDIPRYFYIYEQFVHHILHASGITAFFFYDIIMILMLRAVYDCSLRLYGNSDAFLLCGWLMARMHRLVRGLKERPRRRLS